MIRYGIDDDPDVLRQRRPLPGAVLSAELRCAHRSPGSVTSRRVDAAGRRARRGAEPARPRGRGGRGSPGARSCGVVVGAHPRRAAAPRRRQDPARRRRLRRRADARRVRCAEHHPGMVVPFAPVGATLPGGFKLERRKIRGVVSDGHAAARRASSASATTTPASSSSTRRRRARHRRARGARPRRRRLRPGDHARTAPTRCASSASHASSPRTSACRSPCRSRTGADAIAAIAVDVTVVVEAPERCPRYRRSRRARRDGRVAGVDAAAARERGDAADQQRRRRHQLRDARALPAAARVRPRPARRARHRRAARRATGETMTTLDGVERTLTREDLLICDAERVAAGDRRDHGRRATRRSTATPREILLESAYFEPAGIARSSKRLGLRSEASAALRTRHRPERPAAGADRAIELFARGRGRRGREPATIDRYPQPVERPRVTVRTARVNAILGTDLDATTGAIAAGATRHRDARRSAATAWSRRVPHLATRPRA